jgi:phosphoglycerate dehydrogenase-like enzyme
MDSVQFPRRLATPPAIADSRPIRFLGALSPDERRLFLNGMSETLPGGAASLWQVNWLSDAGAFERQCRELNPEVLLTAWSVGELPPAWLDAPDCALRYVCHITGSVRRLVPRRFIERGGWVTNWGEIPAGPVAEQALLLALAALRNLPAWRTAGVDLGDTIRRVETLATRTLFRRRVGIHGFGRVARALLPLLRPFDVEIVAYSNGVDAEAIHAAGVRPGDSLEALCRHSEVLFECEALTPATAGSVSERMLSLLADGAVFVNVARGQLVDESALLREASRGRLRVALDVIGGGEAKRNRELFQVAGAVLSPHIAGPTFDQYAQCGEFALENIARYVRGEPLRAVVTLADYDRAT